MESKSPTPLSELGEFGLIDALTKSFTLKQSSSLKGVGDDAAVIEAGEDSLVITTDMLTEGIHFDLIYTPLKHLGYKAVVVNLSDVYAMNATPTQITVSIAISSKFSVEALEELYSGIHLACEKYGVDLVGGDTVSSLTGLVISITAIGRAKKEDICYRSGAKENDLICVSGDLGAAYLGLQLLEREKALYQDSKNLQPDLEGYDYVLGRQLKPEARKDIMEMLKEKDIKVNAMIDISDGLSSELLHICKQSEVGCEIYLEKIPIDTTTIIISEEFKLEPSIAALHGGEDYELLFTVPLSEYDKVKDLSEISVIGNITSKEEKSFMINQAGQAIPLAAQGWDGVKNF
jgi:thiamine-monophosphate kinase